MAYADPTRVKNHIIDILNAASGGWGTSVDDLRRSTNAIDQARIESGTEILRAISLNPQNGYHGSLCALVTVTHNQFLPGHDGEAGIPVITPYSGALFTLEGRPADPDEIDSYRNDGANGVFLYQGMIGEGIMHNAAGADNQASPLAGFYSIVAGKIKFTGYSCQIPLIQLTRSMADTGVPDAYEATIIKLSIPKLVKEGDRLFQIAFQYGQLGQVDLKEISAGAMAVSPVPKIVQAQQQL